MLFVCIKSLLPASVASYNKATFTLLLYSNLTFIITNIDYQIELLKLKLLAILPFLAIHNCGMQGSVLHIIKDLNQENKLTCYVNHALYKIYIAGSFANACLNQIYRRVLF